jgi:hypothetical protein
MTELENKDEDLIFEFANVPKRIHHLDVDVKLHIAQPGDKEYKHGPRVKVFRNDPDEPEAFVIQLSLEPEEIVLKKGNFSALMTRGQFKRALDFVKKYRVPLLNLWYKPGADILELQDEMKAQDRGEVVEFYGTRREKK